MKTIDKKNRIPKGTSKREIIKYLVEDPYGHHLLTLNSLTKKLSIFSDLIQLKEYRDKQSKSASFLISSISLCLSFLLVIGIFELEIKKSDPSMNMNESIRNFDALLEIPQTEQIHKPPVKLQAPQIIEVNDEEIIEKIEIDLDIEMTEEMRIEEVIIKQVNEVMPEEKVEEIFTIVEVQPTPVGGMKAFYEFVGKNLKYPGKATRMNIEGRVFVEFVVEKDGSLTDINVAKGIGAGCDEEAIRVISQAQNWNPGKQRGRAVRVRMVMPIVFKLM